MLLFVAFDARHFLVAFALAFSCGRSISSRRGDGVWGYEREHWLTERVAAPRSGVRGRRPVLWCAEAMRAMPIQSFRDERAMPRL